MKHYISVTIGRNYGAETKEVEHAWLRNRPMSTDNWKDFQHTIRLILTQNCNIEGFVFNGTGEGKWAGISEDSYTVAVIASDYDSDKLRHDLYMAGGDFGQDAIALVVVPLPKGDETLIYCT